jgi:kynurenine formamidase
VASLWTAAQRSHWLRERRNWGRWGDDDQKGAVNLVDSQKRVAAAGLVREGITVSLAYPMVTHSSSEDLFTPMHTVKVAESVHAAADWLHMAMHPGSSTHLDGLNHIMDTDGSMWNGRNVSEAFRNNQMEWADIDVWANGIVTRGILLDVVKHRGTPYVTKDRPVGAAELREVAEAQGVVIEPGDAPIVHCGLDAYLAEFGVVQQWSCLEHTKKDVTDRISPGLDITCLEFIRDTDCSLFASDMADAMPHDDEIEGHRYTVHHALWAYGVPLVYRARVGELADVCGRLNRYDCMIVVAPLRVQGGTASPINPIALL